MSPLRGSEGWTSATQGLHPVLIYVTYLKALFRSPSGFRVANMSIIAYEKHKKSKKNLEKFAGIGK